MADKLQNFRRRKLREELTNIEASLEQAKKAFSAEKELVTAIKETKDETSKIAQGIKSE